ncbi:peptide deformylase, partial [Candidatus Protofrankia californiensis]|uniref:peptide deformylase n=1 Tax=Candidatus Protofrankia californiensis TaxID=1839754 RepID=UPI001F49541F
MHARCRLEWNFRAAAPDPAEPTSPSGQMASVGIVQQGAEILRTPAHPLDLPGEDEDARRVIAELSSAIERVAALHTFGKGMGIAAPQAGINRAAAIVRTPDGQTVTLLNPRIIEESRTATSSTVHFRVFPPADRDPGQVHRACVVIP